MIKKSCLELFGMIDRINIAVVFLNYCQQLKLYLSMFVEHPQNSIIFYKKGKSRRKELVNVEILLYTSDGEKRWKNMW